MQLGLSGNDVDVYAVWCLWQRLSLGVVFRRRIGIAVGRGRGGIFLALLLPWAVGGRGGLRRAGRAAGRGYGGFFLALLLPRAVGGRGGVRRAWVAAGRGHGGLFLALLLPQAVGGRGGLRRAGVAAGRGHGGLFLALLPSGLRWPWRSPAARSVAISAAERFALFAFLSSYLSPLYINNRVTRFTIFVEKLRFSPRIQCS